MSIIHDALKKTGQSIAAEAKPEFRPELLKKKSRASWGPIFVMGLLALVAAPILAPLFNGPRTPARAPREIPAGPAVGAGRMQQQFGVEEMPLPMGASPAFSLNGLVYSDTDSYCLINGKVLRVGDKVGGATLSRVTPEGVVLDYRGEKIVLQANAA